MIVAEEVWGILGGGFGLYGYLPAVAERSRGKIHTLANYRETIRGRNDIKVYEDRIVFERDAKALFAHCNAVVIAVRPADQELFLGEILAQKWKGTIVLEKPLARTPALAIALLDNLAASGIKYRIGFTLGATEWATKLGQFLGANRGNAITLNLKWFFFAHHYRANRDTWKRFDAQGGGAMRFYAIHLVAFLAKWGFTSSVRYERTLTEDGEEPECRFTVSTGPWRATVACDTKWHGKPMFRVDGAVNGKPVLEIAMDDPFSEVTRSRDGDLLDVRVGYLSHILNSLDEDGNPDGLNYMNHLKLWEQLERKAELLDAFGASK